MKTINLNDRVRVKLTERGQCILEDYWFRISRRHRKPLTDFMPRQDPAGAYCIRLWEFALIFGPDMREGHADAITEGGRLSVLDDGEI